MRLAVLASGRGSNLQALIDAIDRGKLSATIAAIVSDRTQAGALDIASRHGISTRIVAPRDFPARAEWDAALGAAVQATAPDLVVLAGFMRILGPAFLDRFSDRVINVHPSLLPCFPGADAPAQAIAAGVRVTGCTVHLVDAGVDTGPIIAQTPVPVAPLDTVESLHRRIQTAEHRLLPTVVGWVAAGKVALGPGVQLHSVVRTDLELPVFPALGE